MHVNNAIQKLTEAVIKPLQNEILKLSEQNRILINEIKVLQNVTSQDTRKLFYQQKDGAQSSKYDTLLDKDKTLQANKTQSKKDSIIKKPDGNDRATLESDNKQNKKDSLYKKDNMSDTQISIKEIQNNNDFVGQSTGAIKKQIINNDQNKNVCNNEDNPTDGFTLVKRKTNKNTRSQNTIKGVANTSDLVAATRFIHLHVYWLNKDTTVEKLKSYLNNKNFKQVICEKLNSRRPEEYASFKVSVPTTDLDAIRKPEIWPVGACVNRFFLNLPRTDRKI